MIYKKYARTPFWDKVKKGAGCWIWMAARDRNGYGAYRCMLAHRVSYQLAYGPIPKDKPIICHTCDNPSCVRPDHLFAGTNKDNMQDAVKKGRLPKGEKNCTSKLTSEIVKEMRIAVGRGISMYSLAKKYGVNASTARDAIKCFTWKHVS